MTTRDSADGKARERRIMPQRREPGSGDAEGLEAARRLESEHPKWGVVFGVYTRLFYCIPSFPVPPALNVVTSNYPVAAAERMREAERLYPVRPGTAQWKS